MVIRESDRIAYLPGCVGGWRSIKRSVLQGFHGLTFAFVNKCSWIWNCHHFHHLGQWARHLWIKSNSSMLFFEKNPMKWHQCFSRVQCVSASYFCSKATFTVYFYGEICTFILSVLLYSGGVRWEFASHPTNCSIYTTQEFSHGK